VLFRSAVFCLAALNGKLVAGIDSQVHIYQYFPKGIDNAGAAELILQCEHNGHIMSLFCKTSGELILVGDILRSISVLQLKQTTTAKGVTSTSLEEVSRDFNSNYMRAVEILDDEHFMGSEDNGNIFIVKRASVASDPSMGSVNLTEEEKSRLEMQSAFHVADFINVFRRGMIGSCITSTESNNVAASLLSGKEEKLGEGGSIANVTPAVLFGTVAGCLGAVFTLPSDTYHFLNVLEKSINLFIRSVGGLNHEEFRQFSHERRQGHPRKTIDGDVIELFLDLTASQMDEITKNLNDELDHLAHVNAQETAKVQKKGAETLNKAVIVSNFTTEEVIQRVEELQRLH